MDDVVLDVRESCLGRLWRPKLYDEREARVISQRLDCSDVMGRLMSARQVTIETAEYFVNPTLRAGLPNPSHLKDMDKAVEHICDLIMKGKGVGIFGDYDVDGATSSALLYRFFQSIGVASTVHIPDRIDEGYGPNIEAFKDIKSKGFDTIITVDCGTTSFEPLEQAHELGLSIIVIDHHIGEPKLPIATAVVNPNRLDEISPLKNLAAVGMSFLFAVALNRALRQKGFYSPERPEPDLKNLIDLVALGTVCDVMPLTGLNRAFVKQGLQVMGQRNNLGIRALCDVAGMNEMPSAYHLGFLIGPRINAGGRVGEAGLGAAILREHDYGRATEMAVRLDRYNLERKDIEQQVLDEAMASVPPEPSAGIVVAGHGWHPGVIGIVAGRLKEKYYRPSFVISIDEDGIGKGSARSIPGIDIGSMVQAARQKGILMAGGGHTMAAGLTIAKDKLNDFKAFLNERLNMLKPDLTPVLELDGVLSSKAATVDFINELEKLAPYGVGNPTPRFAFRDLYIVKSDIVGGKHVRAIFGGAGLNASRLNGIAFQAVDTPLGDFLLSKSAGPVHVAGTLKIDSWQGRENVKLFIDDAAPAIEHMKAVG